MWVRKVLLYSGHACCSSRTHFLSSMVLVIFCLGCVSSGNFPPPPPAANAAASDELARLVQQSVVETSRPNRLRLLTEVNALAAKSFSNEGGRFAVAKYIIDCYVVTMQTAAYAKGKSPTPSVDIFPSSFPREVVVFGLTTQQDWIRVLYRERWAYQMLVDAGVFETAGRSPFLFFRHMRDVLNFRQRDAVWETDEFDWLIGFMYTADPLVAACDLLGLSMSSSLSYDEQAKAASEAQTEMIRAASLIRAAVDNAPVSFRPPAGSPNDLSLKLSSDLRACLRSLARRPEWSVHVFVLNQMSTYSDLRDRKIIEILKSQENPVTQRFVRDLVADKYEQHVPENP